MKAMAVLAQRIYCGSSLDLRDLLYEQRTARAALMPLSATPSACASSQGSTCLHGHKRVLCVLLRLHVALESGSVQIQHRGISAGHKGLTVGV